jgi:hypothetical protein
LELIKRYFGASKNWILLAVRKVSEKGEILPEKFLEKG